MSADTGNPRDKATAKTLAGLYAASGRRAKAELEILAAIGAARLEATWEVLEAFVGDGTTGDGPPCSEDHDILDGIDHALRFTGYLATAGIADWKRESEYIEFRDPRDGQRWEIVVRRIDPREEVASE